MPKTLIQRLDEAMARLDACEPIKCTCKTGQMREGKPIYCGWQDGTPVCPKGAAVEQNLFGRVA